MGAVVSEVARRHGITSQQLFGWRRSARGRAIERSDAPGFAAVMLEAPAEKAALDGAVLEILVGAMVARVPLTAFALRPVYERLFDVLKGSDKLFADETRAPVLDPGRRKTKTGQLWAYAFRLGLRGGDRLLDVLQHESELVRIDLLRSRAEAMTLKHLDDADQTLVLVARGDEQFLERPCIVGKRIRRRRHDLTESAPIAGVTGTVRNLCAGP